MMGGCYYVVVAESAEGPSSSSSKPPPSSSSSSTPPSAGPDAVARLFPDDTVIIYTRGGDAAQLLQNSPCLTTESLAGLEPDNMYKIIRTRVSASPTASCQLKVHQIAEDNSDEIIDQTQERAAARAALIEDGQRPVSAHGRTRQALRTFRPLANHSTAILGAFTDFT